MTLLSYLRANLISKQIVKIGHHTPTTPATTAPLDIRLFPGSLGPVELLTNATDTEKGQLHSDQNNR